MNQQIINEARRQTGLYLQEILRQKGWSKYRLAKEAGMIRAQVYKVLDGSSPYTIDTFFKIISALDCYFYIADREGKHLDHVDMIKKM